MQNPDYKAGYVIITRSQKAGNASLGFMPFGTLDKIEKALLASSQFRLVFVNKDATIFALSATPEDLEHWIK